jgi:hypothetical protein
MAKDGDNSKQCGREQTDSGIIGTETGSLSRHDPHCAAPNLARQ